jgi:hypothetical protein
MFDNPTLQLDRKGDTLIMTSNAGGGWLGALFSAFAIAFGVAWLVLAWGTAYTGNVADNPAVLLVPVLGSFVMAATIFLALPHRVTTVFDLRAGSVLYARSAAVGLYKRRRALSFAEIVGLGLKEYSNEGFSYRPVMTLRTGETLRLSTYMVGGGYLSFAKTIADACAATGLPRLDVPYRAWWRRRR